ncbi:MAG TPA: isoaspartyl peptidase/L-asparaginase [Gammaproteobacteria bacterium]
MRLKRRRERPAADAGPERRPRRAAAGWALVIHGGAGETVQGAQDERRERAVREALARVLEEGAAALAAAASSLDVVEQAVCALEDSPLFNAGRGAVFNAHGEHELEASIMDGRTLRAGAVANLRGIKNPVTLARWVMERTPHVCLEGEGAIAFARAHGMELVGPDYFWTEHRWKALKAARLHTQEEPGPPPEHGTVGAVALDRRGDLAAATSTGGRTNKLAGRVGDSSIIGAGTYASNASCAVSCTGHGEYFIRATVARDVCALMEYAGEDVRSAAVRVVSRRLARLGGKGGLIAVDRRGEIACVFNTGTMYRGAVTHDSDVRVALRRGKEL